MEAPFKSTRPDPASAPTPINYLANGVAIKGIIRFANDLVIDGHIDGEITGDGVLTIGSNAEVRGEIKTRSVIIHGQVHGNVTVEDRCELKGRAQLNGDLTAARLTMDEGATYVGKMEVVTDKNRLSSLHSEYEQVSRRGSVERPK